MYFQLTELLTMFIDSFWMEAVFWSPRTLLDGTEFVSDFISCEVFIHEYIIHGVEWYPYLASDTNANFALQ